MLFRSFTLIMSDNSVNWKLEGNRLCAEQDYKKYYVTFLNNNFVMQDKKGASTSFTTATINFGVENNYIIGNVAGGQVCFNVISTASILGNVFPLDFSFQCNSDFFSPWKNGDQLCAYVAPNENIDREATIVITNMLGESIEVIYEQPSSAFRHQQGNSGRALMDNGMQGVHTERIVVYVPLGRQKQLSLLETKYTYSRWYQYDTDASINVGSINLYSTQPRSDERLVGKECRL